MCTSDGNSKTLIDVPSAMGYDVNKECSWPGKREFETPSEGY